ncbi:tape measure protein [Dyadobacter sp. CY323]|uniref:tape measure protein n=1 Tax=Dyadobacter sp. CY323 TaxID=2907302 RepID=UPI001F26DED4|nr:tape measure protein [Dyadobacter sp. CY323]MCE6993052.1 tape measure protein [Dyadobacter sp. CY323]
MSDVEIVVGIKADTAGGRTIKRSLDDIASSGDKATSASKRLELQSRATAAAGQVMVRAFAAAGAVFGASQIIKMADGYKLLEARVNSITGSVRETGRVMGELRKISDQTGSSMEVSVSILQRLSFARNEIKATNDEMIVFTETVTKMGIMSGASAEALKNGLTQLGQALSSDVMRAEEFNSVMENTPGIGKAIADQFGVTTGQLRLLVVEGEVLRDDVFAAILNQAKQVRKEFQEFPKTAEQGFNQMLGRLTQVANEINRATDGTNKLGMLFRAIGDTAKHVYNGISTVFEFMVAGIMEAINLMTKGFNLAIQGINRLKAVTPFANKTPLQTFNTVDAGSILEEARNNTIARSNRLFADDTKDIEINSRNISKNYSEIASGLSKSSKMTKEQSAALKEQKKVQDQLTRAIKDSRTEEEKLFDTIAEMERLKPFAKTTEQTQAIAKNIKNARDELEKLRVEAELKGPTAKAFASLASEIDDGFKDAFKSAFTESDGGFKKLLEGWKNTFKNFLAELAYQAMVRPIMVSLVGGVGGLMGLSGGAVNSVLGNVTGAPGILGGGTGGGLSGLSGLSGLLNGGLYSSTLGNFGANAGFGLGNMMGMSFENAGVMSDLFRGGLGNMGYGAVGGLAASLFGLGSDNSLVNMATGTLGSLAGGAIGSSLGTILGFAGGPVGALAGGFLGTALGGLFGGGKPSDKVQGGGLNLATLETTTNGMTGAKFSQANADFRDKVVQEAINLTKLFQSVGGKTTGDLGYAIGSRDGMRLNVNGNVSNYGTDAQAFVNAMMEAVLQGTTGLTGTFKTIVDKLGVGDTAKLAKAFEFGKIYDEFTKSKDPVDILGESLKALNDQLAELQKTAVELGFPTDELTLAYNKQKEVILGSIKAQMAGFSSLEDMTKTFKSFLDGQALGDSSLSPTQKLQLAQDNFGSLLTKAKGGDLSVTQDLLKAASELLNIGRGVYASSVSFAGLESFVRSSVTDIARAAGVPGYAMGTNSASAGLAMVGERGRELVRMGGGEKVWTAGETAGIMALSGSMANDIARTNSQIVSLNSEILAEQKEQRKEMVYLRKQFQRIGDKMAVSS